MCIKQLRKNSGFTLIETIIAAVCLVIIALGALSYQYHAAMHNHIARSQMIATRTAQLLLEDWKNNGGSAEYDPASLELGFIAADEKDWGYFVIVDNLPMYINLSGSEVVHDEEAGVTLRELIVRIAWKGDYTQEAPDADDPYVMLTTYARVDASGG